MAEVTISQLPPLPATPYDDPWYDKQLPYVLESARVYTRFLWQYVQPRSVLDVGCGRGTWLKAWHECGSSRLIGYDGAWNGQEKMIDPEIEFVAVDLNRSFTASERVDLASSLEVAEHLEPLAAGPFVQSLAGASDLVLFSAAFPYQGGTAHINEQLPSYWARLFSEHGFVPFDLLRPVFWGDDRVCHWYRQNAFLYARMDATAYAALRGQGFAPIADPHFMDCVHPIMYRMKVDGKIPFRSHLADLAPSLIRAIRRRLG